MDYGALYCFVGTTEHSEGLGNYLPAQLETFQEKNNVIKKINQF